jgi:hypothetical protein
MHLTNIIDSGYFASANESRRYRGQVAAKLVKYLNQWHPTASTVSGGRKIGRLDGRSCNMNISSGHDFRTHQKGFR